ncbi:unnamed protein product [Echinostoma caproni]|uniref:Doublecortin domain-containing protein n=1 Tax=Echinostoma caproni TaxID=27848 RepID=A0A183AG47_9TREM|nr:unnamed protein product [Echinostoma caproni]
MGGSQTKFLSKNSPDKRHRSARLRRHDYRVASAWTRRLLDWENFPPSDDADSYFSGLSASVPNPAQPSSLCRDNSVVDNQESNTRPTVKIRTQSINDPVDELQSNLPRTRKTGTSNEQTIPKPVTRHQSVIITKSLTKAPTAVIKKDARNISKSVTSKVSPSRKSRSNGQITDKTKFQQGDTAFASSAYGLNDSPRGTARVTEDLVTRSATFLNQSDHDKFAARSREDFSTCSQDLPTGDTQEDPIPRNASSKDSKPVRYAAKSRLSEKPPTPPPKISLSKASTMIIANSNFAIRPSTANRNLASPTRGAQSHPATPCSQRSSTGRANSLPRTTSTRDYRVQTPQTYSVPSSPSKPRRSGSVSQHSSADTDRPDKPPCLSRIEYTFYIHDTEAYQRPFFDRRVEAIARASQCNICLHKPPRGQKPIYYKGNRVLPVTISARTMVTLKRCMARLDMQYPYFNVKAFCPPDMY